MKLIEWFLIILAIILLTVWQLPLSKEISLSWVAIWLIFAFFTMILAKNNFLISLATDLFTLYAWTMMIAMVLIAHFPNQGQLRQANLKLLIVLFLNYGVVVPRMFQVIHFRQLTMWPLVQSLTRGLFTINIVMAALLVAWVLATVVVTRGKSAPDYILILGAALTAGHPGPILRARLQRGLDLSKRYPNAKLVVSGAGSDPTNTQAEAMKQALVEQGIGPSQILVEPTAMNTRDNLRQSLALISKSDSVTNPAVLVVTSNFHVLRTWTYAKKLPWQVHLKAATTPLAYLPLTAVRDFLGLLRDHYLLFLIVIIIALVATV